MAQLYTHITQWFDDAAALTEAIDYLKDDQIITASQLATLRDAISPLLPCHVKIGYRTPLSIVYCEAGGRMFRVGQRGAFMPGAWRANMKTKRFW